MAGKVLLTFLTFGFLVISWLAWKIFNLVWWKPMKLQRYLREQGINGHPYKLFYGNVKDLLAVSKEARSKRLELSHDIVPRVNPFAHKTTEQYDKMYFFWYGTTPRVQIMDPDIIKEILSNKSGDIRKLTSSPLAMLLTGIGSYEGEKWVKHRRIVNPAFHVDKLKMMLPAFYSSCSEMVNKWQKLVSQGLSKLDVWHEFQLLTGDVISQAAFGSSYEEGPRIFELQTEQSELLIKGLPFAYIPGFRYLPTRASKRSKEIGKEVSSLVMGIINKRVKAIKAEEANKNDLLCFLMESNLKDIQDNENSKQDVGMTLDEVIDECKLFYFTGQETISSLLVWTMVAMSIHPEWQERARDEILLAFGKRKPDFDGLNHLKIVTMILYEVIRLYPPVGTLLRNNCKEMKLGKISLPPGVTVAMPILLIHRDRELWGDDAEEFNPRRFSDGISKATKNRGIFFPFGWGPRICVGQTFALIEAKMALALILQNFSFELSATYVHAPHAFASLQPEHGAQFVLHKI